MGEMKNPEMPSAPEQPEADLESARQEIQDRFPRVDGAELRPEDLRLYLKMKGDISKQEFDKWRTETTLQEVGVQGSSRIKLVVELSKIFDK